MQSNDEILAQVNLKLKTIDQDLAWVREHLKTLSEKMLTDMSFRNWAHDVNDIRHWVRLSPFPEVKERK